MSTSANVAQQSFVNEDSGEKLASFEKKLVFLQIKQVPTAIVHIIFSVLTFLYICYNKAYTEVYLVLPYKEDSSSIFVLIAVNTHRNYGFLYLA